MDQCVKYGEANRMSHVRDLTGIFTGDGPLHNFLSRRFCARGLTQYLRPMFGFRLDRFIENQIAIMAKHVSVPGTSPFPAFDIYTIRSAYIIV